MNYKKYSLENLSNWLYDAMSCGEATPQEIYDVIVNVVEDEYYTYKKRASESYELLTLLNNNPFSEEVKELGKLWDKEDVEAILKEREFYEPSMPPWGHSDMEYLANPTLTEDRISNFPGEQYSEEELNAMCDKAASDEEKEKCREYNLREAEYYDKRAELDIESEKIKSAGEYDWTPVGPKDGYPFYVNQEGDVCIPDYVTKDDKVKRWILPTQIDGLTGDVIVNLPDDLLERAGLKEGDVVEYINRGDGSFEMRKVNVTKY